MSASPNIICDPLKKPKYNYNTYNMTTNMIISVGIISNTSKRACFKTVSLDLNPFKSYAGSISGFGMTIKNKF